MKPKTVWVRLLVGLAVVTAFLWGMHFGILIAIRHAVKDVQAPLDITLKQLGQWPCDVIPCRDCAVDVIEGACVANGKTPAGQLPTGVR